MSAMKPKRDPERLTVAVPDPYSPDLLKVLRDGVPSGWTLLTPDSSGQTADFSSADVIFAMWNPVSRETIEAIPALQLVQKLGAGVDRIDLDAAKENEVAVARLFGINAVAVAEHIMMFILASLRNLPVTQAKLLEGGWHKEEARSYQRELRGKTVGLIGVGNVGQEVAKRLAPFEATTIYYDVNPLDSATAESLQVRRTGLDELLREADIISLHVPLIPETRHLINRSRIELMKPGAIVVNCARGGLIDEQALKEALESGRIASAALDTFAEEPITDLGLIRLENVIATPHAAGATKDNFVRVVAKAVENAKQYASGKGLPVTDAVYVPPV